MTKSDDAIDLTVDHFRPHVAKVFRVQDSELAMTLDEVQVYRHLRMVEDRRRVEGKTPKVRSFTQEEQREWERQHPKPPCDAESELQSSEGDHP